MPLLRLTRRRQVRILETRLRLANDELAGMREQFAKALNRISDQQAELDAMRAEPRAAGPALADNIRLAHRAEQAEALQRTAEDERDHLMGRLLRLTSRHPHLLAPDEVER